MGASNIIITAKQKKQIIFKKSENKAKVCPVIVDNYNMGASNIETSTKNKSKKIVFFAKVLVFCVDNYNKGTKNIGARLNNGS